MQTLQATLRQTIIVQTLQEREGVKTKELIEIVKKEMGIRGFSEAKISTRTLKRTIAKIRDNISIEYKRGQGYILAKDEDISSRFKTIMESFDILYALHADMNTKHFVLPERQAYRGTEHLYPLLEAIQQCHPVTFHYQKYAEGAAPCDLTAFPYALKECHKRWYMLGIEKGDETLKTYGLDRMSLLRPEDGKFKKKDIDIDARYKDSYGIVIMGNTPTEEILLSFNTRDAKYVESLPIHHSQQTLPHPTDSKRVMFLLKMKITEDLILALLSRGHTLQVHAPDHLRETICDHLRETLERNTAPCDRP